MRAAIRFNFKTLKGTLQQTDKPNDSTSRGAVFCAVPRLNNFACSNLQESSICILKYGKNIFSKILFNILSTTSKSSKN